MIQHILSAMPQDDTSRLHHVPFLLLWGGAYGVVWLFIFLYEKPFIQELCDLNFWMRGGYGHTTIWRTELFIGLIAGTVLASIHGGLLQRRYRFIPKFWILTTVLGMAVGGLGYHPLGTSIGGTSIWAGNEILLWFGTMAMFQSLAMMRITKHGWLIGLVGIISTVVAIAVIFVGGQSLSSQRMALIMGTAFQALGTGFVMMYLMSNLSFRFVPKRDMYHKVKPHYRESLSPVAFFILWITVNLIALGGMLLSFEPGRNIRFESFLYPILWSVEWYVLFSYAIFGLILGIAQHWLIKQLTGQILSHWQWGTFIGWSMVGVFYLLVDQEILILDTNTVIFLWFAIPIVLQSILLTRIDRMASAIWIIAGILACLVQLSTGYSIGRPYHSSFIVFAFSSSLTLSVFTACAFLLISRRWHVTPKIKTLPTD